ncbi:MAG: haloacid dehalogenase-like hydrolase [Spirochaetes bacterium]|nr:haloacid dehalogenase-like hydrolase [Spirochaetota bacterium]
MYKGLVVFDVDGVIFKDIFLKKIVQSKGLFSHLRFITLGMRYYREKISIEELLQEGYRLAGTFSVEEAHRIARRIKRRTSISETIEILRKNGYYVSLISAGIPNFILQTLMNEIGAHHYAGLDISSKNGRWIVDDLTVVDKTGIVEEIMSKLGIGWERVVAVGDDPGNIELLKKSGVGIGFNPVKSVRMKADVVIEGDNFLEILPYILPQESLPSSVSISRFNWRREIFRKAVHLTGSVFPFLARLNEKATVLALLSVIVAYLLSELFRTFGLSVSVLSQVTRRAQRHSEKRGIIIGPVLLGIGIGVTIMLFRYEVYLPAVLVVAISDSVSALVGRRFGRIRILGMKNRTVEGSLAFFFSAFAILILFYPLPHALLATVVATLMELVPVYNLDNFLIPLGTALILAFLRGTG